MDTKQIVRFATSMNTCIGVIFDPAAEPRRQWVASVGLVALGAGKTPGAALRRALGDLRHCGVREDTLPHVRRGRLALSRALR